MSSKKKPQLLGPDLEMLPHLEGKCSSTNSECGAKNTTTAEHASEGDGTTVSMSQPGNNTDDFVKKQAFGQRHLRNITNQISLGPSPTLQPKECAKEQQGTNDELISKKVDRLLAELSHELDKLLSLCSSSTTTSDDSNEFNLSSDEKVLDETNSSNDDPAESANNEAHARRNPGNSFVATCKRSTRNSQLAETRCQSYFAASAASKELLSFKKLTEAGLRNVSKPSSSLDAAQILYKLPASRFKAEETDEPTVRMTSGVKEKEEHAGEREENAGEKEEHAGEKEENAGEKEENAGEKEENAGEREEHAGEKEVEEEEKEDEVEFVKPPNWLDPLLIRSVPELKKKTNPKEPCPPDTFFGKLHRNSPLAYTGHEKEPLKKEDSPAAAARVVELLREVKQKPLDEEEKVKETPPLDHISCSSKGTEMKASEEPETKQETRNSEEQRNSKEEEPEPLERELQKGEMKEVKASEKNNDSHEEEDASGMKELQEVIKTMIVEELKDSLSSLEVPHSQATGPPVVKTISAKEKDTLQSSSKESLPFDSQDSLPLDSQDSHPLHSQDAALSSHVKDSISSASKNAPTSPNKDPLPLRSRDAPSPLYSQDSLPSKSNDSILSKSKDYRPLHGNATRPSHSNASRPSHSKETAHSTTTTDYPISLSKDSPPSHSRTSPSPHSTTDYVPTTHSKDDSLAATHSKDAAPSASSPGHTDSRPSLGKDFSPHSHSFLPIQEQEETSIIEQYDPEFPALATPPRVLNVGNLDMMSGMPTARANHLNKWLYSQSLLRNEYEQQAMEVLPEYSLIQYSDDDEEEEQEEQENDQEQEQEGSVSAKPAKNLEDALQKGLQSLQLKEAIPECCLTDSVFLVDKPKSAVSLGFKLPVMPLEQTCPVKSYLTIRVTHVYTPFQFWFNLVNHSLDSSALLEMQLQMGNFYNDCSPDYCDALPRCLIKAGYICAIRLKDGWRRARILAHSASASASPIDSGRVSIYYPDYGYGVDVPAADLRFLPQIFGETPALAVRGTLSHIHPLGPHWSPDSMEQFQRLIIGKQLFAHIMELDLEERVVFLRISLNEQFAPSVNRMLVDANLAARSQHYDLRLIESNFGRRPRYLRERLPSHEMLETRVFPMLNNEFEVAFDGIIYSPAFGKFMVPRLKKAYAGLRQALVAWMPAYRKEMEEWAVLFNEAKAKVRLAQCKAREAWLWREEQKRIEQARNHKMEVPRAHEPQEMATQEAKETLKATQKEEETLTATQKEEQTLKTTQEAKETLKATQEAKETLKATQKAEKPLKATQKAKETLKTTQKEEEEDEETITATDEEDDEDATHPQAGGMEEVD